MNSNYDKPMTLMKNWGTTMIEVFTARTNFDFNFNLEISKISLQRSVKE